MGERPIRIIDETFQFQAEIGDYESLTFTRCYDTYGSFEFRINQHKRHVEHLQKGAIIYLSPEKAGIIQYREASMNEGGKKSQTLTIRGYTLEHLLTYRITEALQGKDVYEAKGKAEDVVKELIAYNLGAQAPNLRRRMPEVVICPSQGRGEQAAISTAYVPLDEECQKILSQSGLGLKVTLDYGGKKFMLDVYEGRVLTTEQSAYPPVIFSEEFDNIASRNLVDSLLEFKNTAVVLGQQKGMETELSVINDENSGLSRREVYIDVGTMEKNSVVSLVDRGRDGLLSYKPIYTLEGTVIANASFRYGKDYELGDVVTVRYQDGNQQLHMNTRIVQVTETYDDNGFHLEVIFGNRVPTVIDKLKRMVKGKQL